MCFAFVFSPALFNHIRPHTLIHKNMSPCYVNLFYQRSELCASVYTCVGVHVCVCTCVWLRTRVLCGCPCIFCVQYAFLLFVCVRVFVCVCVRVFVCVPVMCGLI